MFCVSLYSLISGWTPITLTVQSVDYDNPLQMLFISSIVLLRHAQKANSMRRTLSLFAVTLLVLLINIDLMNEEKGEDTLSVMISMVPEGLEKKFDSVHQAHLYLPSLNS